MKDYKNWDNIAVVILETGIKPEGRTIRACRAFCLRNNHKYPGTRTIRENERLIRRIDEKFSTKGHQMKDTELEIATSKIRENPNNPRSEIGSVEDLKSSIQKNGFFGTILVRPLNNDTFEVIAGSRRFRACQELGMKTVRCEVRKCDDATAYQIATAENIVRENMNAVDEANAVAKLFAQGKSRREIAAIFGKTPRWAEGRRKIVQLGDKAMEMLAAGKINLGHAEVLTMCHPEDVNKWLDSATWRTPEQLKEDIMRKNPVLERAPFDCKAECKGCENRSDRQADLFGDVTAAHCLDRECYDRKIHEEANRIRYKYIEDGYDEVPEDDTDSARYGWEGYIDAESTDEDDLKEIEERKAEGVKQMFWVDDDTAEHGIVWPDIDSEEEASNGEDEESDDDNSWSNKIRNMDNERRNKVKADANIEERGIVINKLKEVFGMLRPETKAFILELAEREHQINDDGDTETYLKHPAEASAEFLDEVADSIMNDWCGVRSDDIREYFGMDSREAFEQAADEALGDD